MLNEAVLVLALLAYVTLYVLLIRRSRRSAVGWTWPLLCMAPAMYIAWAVFGAVYDMNFTVELVQVLRARRSPWGMEHNFPYLPGYPVLLTPIVWTSQSVDSIAIGAKSLNFAFLMAFGLAAGRIAFPDAPDVTRRGVLYFSCHPLLVAIALWHGQFEIVVVTLLLLSLLYWQSARTVEHVLGGFAYGLAVSVKHWPLVVLPVLMYGPPRRLLRLFAGAVAAVIGIVGLHVILNGSFANVSRILTYSGNPSSVGVLQALGLPEPPGWNVLSLVVAVAVGMAIRRKGARTAEAGMFTLLFFLLLSFRSAPQYWVWFLALAPFCVSGHERLFWLASGSLSGIVILQEWGFVLGWQGSYPHSTWQGNYPHLRDYPHLSSAALWLFEIFWRPLFLVAVLASGVWYYQSYGSNAARD